MAGDRVKIAAHRLHIHRHMHRRLTAINQNRHALVTCAVANRGHIDHGAQHV